jgi:ABC-type multidrug transport system fused ATPase/permease subunit
MAINRVAGLALPFSPKYFFDDVIAEHQTEKLLPLVLVVVGATIIQGITSFSLTQLLSKSAQRMITDMRKRVQAHIGRLPITYYDSHKTGELVSRIMSDVEGIRNLIGRTRRISRRLDDRGHRLCDSSENQCGHDSPSLSGSWSPLACSSTKPSPPSVRFFVRGRRSTLKSLADSPSRLAAYAW